MPPASPDGMIPPDATMTEQPAALNSSGSGSESSEDQIMAIHPQPIHLSDEPHQPSASAPALPESEMKDNNIATDTDGSEPCTSILSSPTELPVLLAELVMDARRDFDSKLKALLTTSNGLSSEARNDFFAKVDELHAKDTETTSEWEKAMIHVNIALGQLKGHLAWTEIHEDYSHLVKNSDILKDRHVEMSQEYVQLLKEQPRIAAEKDQLLRENIGILNLYDKLQEKYCILRLAYERLVRWGKEKPEFPVDVVKEIEDSDNFSDGNESGENNANIEEDNDKLNEGLKDSAGVQDIEE